MKSYENNSEQIRDEQQNAVEFRPYQNPEEMTDLEGIEDRELEIVAENSDVLGYNIDSKVIVNPERYAQATKAKEYLEAGGDMEILVAKYGQPAEEIRAAIDEELSKADDLDKVLNKLPEGVKLRVHPFGPISPFSIEKAVHRDEEGNIVAHIDNEAIAQVQKMKEKAGDTDLIVVMNPFHRDENGEGTSNIPDDSAEYIALCDAFVNQSGYGESNGKGLVIELGNECNLCEKHGDAFKTGAFAESVEPDKYAKLYFETAKALKAKYPDLKISLAGTGFNDKNWVETVVRGIQRRKEDEAVEQGLIDIISVHPYRRTTEEPAPEINGDEIGHGLERSFDEQLDGLRMLADPLGAEVTIGEVSFYKKKWGESVNENEQIRNAIHGREKGYISYIWPGDQIVKYENPN